MFNEIFYPTYRQKEIKHTQTNIHTLLEIIMQRIQRTCCENKFQEILDTYIWGTTDRERNMPLMIEKQIKHTHTQTNKRDKHTQLLHCCTFTNSFQYLQK